MTDITFLGEPGRTRLLMTGSAGFGDCCSDYGAAPASVYKKEQFWDVNLFWNVTPAVRVGAEFASFKQTMGDDTERKNARGQFSGFYLF